MRFILAGNCFGRGGIQTHLRWTAQLLRRAGHEVALVATLPRQAGEDDLQTLSSAGVEIGEFSDGSGSKRAKLRRLPGMVQFVRRFRPDVYFVVGAGWVPMVLKPLAARASRGIFFEVMSGNWHHRRADPRALTAMCFDEVVSQTPRVGRAFRRGFSWRKAIPAIPAIPEPLEEWTQIPPAEPRRVARGSIKAAMFSRLGPDKRADWLVQQWPMLREILAELHIHGDGPDSAGIRNWIESHGADGRVVWHGPYPDGQAYVDLIRRYDLTLLPTVGDEGAPLVLLESMACGVPFVAGGVGGIPDYALGNPDCLIASTRPDRFVEAVREMAERLDRSTIDQSRIQRYYQTHFRHQLLAESWTQYLTGQSNDPFVWPRNE